MKDVACGYFYGGEQLRGTYIYTRESKQCQILINLRAVTYGHPEPEGTGESYKAYKRDIKNGGGWRRRRYWDGFGVFFLFFVFLLGTGWSCVG